jgi:TRAP-type C4-dicarboxylate transport system permease small subunit
MSVCLLAGLLLLAYAASTVGIARADVDMTGRLEKASSLTTPLGAVHPLATSANGTYRCADEYSVIANWYYYFAIGNCPAGAELEVVSYASENTQTHEHSYGGFVNGAFSGCGWINTAYPLEKLNNNSHSACAGSGSSHEFKIEESSFMERYNRGTVGDGNPVVNTAPCPEYANYRPWSSNNVEKELIRTAPAYAASGPGSNYPALKWRYITKYGSIDGSGKYVMVRDDRVGETNWVFVPRSCLPASLPENSEERLPPPPTVTTGGFGNVTTSSATLTGSVNPNGLDTDYYIEWGPEASKPYEAFAPTPYPGEDVGAGHEVVNKSVTATGLKPDTVYYYRIVAQSPTGTSEGSEQHFTTAETPPPSATTGGATELSSSGAVLHGEVNPDGAATTYWFEYGRTTAYGSRSAENEAGTGGSVPAAASVAGLAEGASYHYRLVATNGRKTSYGLDAAFKTSVRQGSWAVYEGALAGQWVYPRASEAAVTSWVWTGAKWEAKRIGGEVAAGTTPTVMRESLGGGHEYQWIYYVGAETHAVEAWVWTSERWEHEVLGGNVAEGTSPVALREKDTSGNSHWWVYYVDATSHKVARFVRENSAEGFRNEVIAASEEVAPDSTPSVMRERFTPGTESNSEYQWVYYVNTEKKLESLVWINPGWSKVALGGSVAADTSPVGLEEKDSAGNYHWWVYYVEPIGGVLKMARFVRESSAEGYTRQEIGGEVEEHTSPSAVRQRLGSGTKSSEEYQWVDYVDAKKHGISEFVWNDGWASEYVGGNLTAGTSPLAQHETVGSEEYHWVYYADAETHGISRWSWKGGHFEERGKETLVAPSSHTSTTPSVLREKVSGAEYAWDYYVDSETHAIARWVWTGSRWEDESIGGEVAAGTTPTVIRESLGGGHEYQWIYYVGAETHAVEAWVWTSERWEHEVLGGNVAEGTSPVALREKDTSGNSHWWVYYVDATSHKVARFVRENSAEGFRNEVIAASEEVAPDSTPSVMRERFTPGTESNSEYQWVYYVNTEKKLESLVWINPGWSKVALGGSVAADTSPVGLEEKDSAGNYHWWVYYVEPIGGVLKMARFVRESSAEGYTRQEIGGEVEEHTSPSAVRQRLGSGTKSSEEYQWVDYVDAKKHGISEFVWNDGWASEYVGGNLTAGTSPLAQHETVGSEEYHWVYYADAETHGISRWSWKGGHFEEKIREFL